MEQPLLPDGVNAFGIAALAAFLLCWIGAMLAGLAIHRAGDAPLYQQWPGVWAQAEPRKRFLRFLAFCLIGFLCGITAMTFGGWTSGHQ